MAEAGLFVGWGDPITGREANGLEVFGEALAYYAKAEQDGRPTAVSLPASSWPAAAGSRWPRCAQRTSSSGSTRGPR